MNIEKIKSQFPILKQKNRGKPLVYFDNAATSLKPLSVIDSESDFYKNYYGSVHRSVYELGEKATNAFEGTRNKVAEFIGIKDSSSIIFTKGATEAINLVADAWGHTNLNKGDVVLLTEMEHHSNIVPWQIITKRTGATLDYITVQPDGSLDMNSLKSKLTSKVKMLSLTHASNVLGTINPIKEIINLAHENNTLVMVDGCQSAPHFKINVEELGCDFFAFSGRKMLGPTGVGVLYGKKDLLEKIEPLMGGGEMISDVTFEKTTYANLPHKHEAGTPNISGVIAFGVALDYMNSIGFDKIKKYEDELLNYANKKLKEIDGLIIYGDVKNKTSVISFNISGIHSYDIGSILDRYGIAVRTGQHCTQPIMDYFKIPGTVRVSLSFINTFEEIDTLYEAILKAKLMLS